MHHVVYRQELRRHAEDIIREEGLLRDRRNLVPVSPKCHAKHHSRQRAFELSMLPDSVFEFAEEVLGAGPAYEYLSRRYKGGDDRLDALLHAYEEAA